MKVCVIEPVGAHGGMDYYDVGLCDGLSENGVDVVLHTCERAIFVKEVDFEVRPTYAGIYNSGLPVKRGLMFLKATIVALISAVIERRRIVHFHLFNVGLLVSFGIFLSKLLRRKTVITAHDVEPFASTFKLPFLSTWVYRAADKIIAHNEISKTELTRCFNIEFSKIEVIPSGNYIHTTKDAPSKESARTQLMLGTTKKVILFFGQIKKVKGLDLLLEAMPALIEKYPDLLLLIAGRPWKTSFSKYRKIIDELGLSANCITHIRFISDEELPYYYMASDLVVLPYKRIYQSAVVLMAMSFGKPVLASDLPGMTDIISSEKVGLLFKSGNRESLIERLDYALMDESRLNAIADGGLHLMRNSFDWVNVGTRTRFLYRSLAK